MTRLLAYLRRLWNPYRPTPREETVTRVAWSLDQDYAEDAEILAAIRQDGVR